jgi:methyl coenzyme M reductase beta subunit
MTTVKTTESGQVTTESIPDAGTYTQNGTAVTFTFNSDGSSGTGTLNGNTVTVASQGFSLVYTR